jgi:hypothetical protein
MTATSRHPWLKVAGLLLPIARDNIQLTSIEGAVQSVCKSSQNIVQCHLSSSLLKT